MNKKGMSAGVIVLIILFAGLVFAGVMIAVNQSGTANVQEQLTTTQNCAVEPYLDITVRNASRLDQTSGSATFEYGQNGKKIGALTSGASGTALRLGETYDLIVSQASHLDQLVSGIKVDNCGANKLTVDFWRSDGVNITVYNSAGTSLTDDAIGGATNQSSISAGQSRNLKVEINTLSDQSADPLYLTIEVTNKTQVQDLRLSAVSSGLTITEVKKSLPKFASDSNTTAGLSPYVEVFKISGLAGDGVVNTLTLTIEASASWSIDQTSVYVTPYTAEAFTDVDGTFVKEGIEDSDGNAQYEDLATDFDFQIT